MNKFKQYKNCRIGRGMEEFPNHAILHDQINKQFIKLPGELSDQQILDLFSFAIKYYMNEKEKFFKSEKIKEKLAEYCHKSWTGWMVYLFEKSKKNRDGTVTIPKWAVDRWKLQISTKFVLLPEQMKQSDFKEANKIIKVLKNV